MERFYITKNNKLKQVFSVNIMETMEINGEYDERPRELSFSLEIKGINEIINQSHLHHFTDYKLNASTYKKILPNIKKAYIEDIQYIINQAKYEREVLKYRHNHDLTNYNLIMTFTENDKVIEIFNLKKMFPNGIDTADREIKEFVDKTIQDCMGR